MTGFLNGFDTPFSNLEARLTINHAVNKKQIIDHVCHGLGIPATTVVSPYHCGYESSMEPIFYDQNKSKRLFDKIGGPSQIIIRTPQSIPAHGEEIACLIKENLESIGFNVTVDVQTDRPAYTGEACQKHIGHLGLYDSSPHSAYRVLYDKISSRIHST